MPRILPVTGERESQVLELKSAEALRSREGRRQILRSIVGMMNAKAGTGCIWVGVAERDGAMECLEPLGDPDERHVDALRDAIVDSIEPNPTLAVGPSPKPAEVMLEHVPVPTGGWILRITVEPRGDERPPAGLRSGNQREFLVRTGARVAPLSYEHLFRLAGKIPSKAAERDIDERTLISSRHHEWTEAMEPVGGLAITILPLPFRTSAAEPDPTWVETIRQPSPELARPDGWTWFAGTASIRRRRGSIVSGVKDPRQRQVWRYLEIDASGHLRFFTDLESLVWLPQRVPGAEELFPDLRGLIGPLCLVESIVSVVRLGWHLLVRLTDGSTGERIGAIVSLEGVEGWLLPLGHPARFSIFYRQRDQWIHFDRPEVASRAFLLDASKLRTRADADSLAYSLLRDLYESDPEAAEIEAGVIPWFSEGREFVPRS